MQGLLGNVGEFLVVFLPLLGATFITVLVAANQYEKWKRRRDR